MNVTTTKQIDERKEKLKKEEKLQKSKISFKTNTHLQAL